jgi:hypothetical protein
MSREKYGFSHFEILLGRLALLFILKLQCLILNPYFYLDLDWVKRFKFFRIKIRYRTKMNNFPRVFLWRKLCSEALLRLLQPTDVPTPNLCFKKKSGSDYKYIETDPNRSLLPHLKELLMTKKLSFIIVNYLILI